MLRQLRSFFLFFLFLISSCIGRSQNTSSELQDENWWKSTTIYQIYPRSYCDTDGDGIGDIQGIISKLDYIRDLGFETIWISPFFESPQGDFGYDIRDYYAIEPDYGDLSLVDSLIYEVHRRDMKIVFDLVLNHTSIEHAWFRESMSSKDNDKSDFYIWKDGSGRNGKKPPNNWNNVFNKKSWHYAEERNQFFYTAFLDFQPDLNWRNPQVRTAMFDMVKYWLSKDVDGFRLDIFNCIMEDPSFKDNPFAFKLLPSKDAMKAKFQKKERNINHPDNFELARQLRDTIDRFSQPSRFLVGEAIGPLEDIHPLVGKQNEGLNLIFLFDMIYFDFKARFFRKRILEFEEFFPAPLMPTIVYGNHDNFRRSRRVKNDQQKEKLLALYQFTARGVPVIYYGEEIGMTNAVIPKKEAKDPISTVFKGLPQFLRNILPVPVNRDVCRTPMQWTEETNAGFCPPNSTPWLPVGNDLATSNVDSQLDDPLSLLNTYRDLTHLRNENIILQQGSITLVNEEFMPKNVLGYIRQFEEERWLILMNFSKKPVEVELGQYNDFDIEYKLHQPGNTANEQLITEKQYGLNAFEGAVLHLK